MNFSWFVNYAHGGYGGMCMMGNGDKENNFIIQLKIIK
jgi:hypothetical protein